MWVSHPFGNSPRVERVAAAIGAGSAPMTTPSSVSFCRWRWPAFVIGAWCRTSDQSQDT